MLILKYNREEKMKRQTKKQILEFLHFWPMTIVVPILLMLILFPGIAGAKEKYLDSNYSFKSWQMVSWAEDTGALRNKYEIVEVQKKTPHTHAWVTDIVRDGEYAIKLEYHDNDCGTNDCRRGDYKGQFGRTGFGWMKSKQWKDSWSRFSVFIPEDTSALPNGAYTMFTQFKTDTRGEKNNCPQIALGFMLDEEGIRIFQEPGDKDCSEHYQHVMYNDEDFKGKWLDIVVHSNWSNKEDGFVYVWFNGDLKYEFEGLTLYNDHTYMPWMRNNIYTGKKTKGHKQKQVFYFDAFYHAKTCDKMKLDTLGYSCKELVSQLENNNHSCKE